MEISDAGFDLLEICHKDEIHLHEIWKNSKTSEVIRFNIIQEDLTDEVDECEDASRQDVVSELVDLWLELRAIRNHFTEVSDEEKKQIITPAENNKTESVYRGNMKITKRRLRIIIREAIRVSAK